MTIFKCGEFTSHSGKTLPFKIDCDGLSDEDINCIAEIIAGKVNFSVVSGIPRGGVRLAKALKSYEKSEAYRCLIVDDVCTTGSSLEDWKATNLSIPSDRIAGYVIFDRGGLPDWVNAVFHGG